MPFYRIGEPGADTWAHLNFGRRSGPQQCASPAFPNDDHSIGPKCARASVALCDHPGCDAPMCELHRIMHPKKANTDFCPDHRADAGAKECADCQGRGRWTGNSAVDYVCKTCGGKGFVVPK